MSEDPEERLEPLPWHADTLEWATTSPPPVYNFLEIPIVEGRHPLWDRSAVPPVVTGVAADRREVLVKAARSTVRTLAPRRVRHRDPAA